VKKRGLERSQSINLNRNCEPFDPDQFSHVSGALKLLKAVREGPQRTIAGRANRFLRSRLIPAQIL
jgi:hypothetical protein